MPQFILKINTPDDKIYDDDKIVCYLADTALPDSLLQNLCSGSKMLLLSGAGAPERCKQIGADGVVSVVDTSKPVKAPLQKVREVIGEKAVLVPVIPPRRHEAMLAAETEPALVAFTVTPENLDTAAPLLKWYNELFLIQSAVDLTAGLVDISDLEADFVIINSADYADFSC